MTGRIVPPVRNEGKSRWRPVWIALGWVLIAASLPVGLLPGPGGIFVFAAGAALLLRNSAWARRRYAVLKRRWPRIGEGVDRVLRRPSALRRRAVARARAPDAD